VSLFDTGDLTVCPICKGMGTVYDHTIDADRPCSCRRDVTTNPSPPATIPAPFNSGALGEDDQRRAEKAGRERYQRRRAAGSQQRYNRVSSHHTVEKEIEAIGAEIAFARLIGEEWVDGPTPDYDGDVGSGMQVRHTAHKNGHLLIHPGDSDDHFFFLVTGNYPVFTVVGWLRGADGKSASLWKELVPGRPAFCVPQGMLRKMSEWASVD
jgi:hypothetical protein